MPSVAVKLAADFLGDLTERRMLVIGAVGRRAAARARDRGVGALFVANRATTAPSGSPALGRRGFVRRPAAELERADIVVSATGAPRQILGREELELVAAQGWDGRS